MSLVLHPRNPYAPTVHMNVRMFVADASDGRATPVWWFGGGMDLTPYYGFDEDAVHFHRTCRDALRAVRRRTLHPQLQELVRRVFLPQAPQRAARRRRHLLRRPRPTADFDRCFALQRSVGDHFLAPTCRSSSAARDTPYGERERDFQAYRRGRYVEFNLVCDRGTLFGLQSGGRTESILMSLPPVVKWRYDWQPEPGAPEAKLYTDFLVARDWLAEPAAAPAS